jgi:hypothetical protein
MCEVVHLLILAHDLGCKLIVLLCTATSRLGDRNRIISVVTLFWKPLR